MSCRSHATKPAIALWVLVALADLALLVATVGVLTVVLAVAAVVAAAVVGLWMMGHRPRAAAMPGPSRLRRRA